MPGSGGRRRGPPGGGWPCPVAASHPASLCPDITGPIILQTYRAIADFEKSSGSQMALATGDVVDVVEKSESGQPPPPAVLPPQGPHPWPQAPQMAPGLLPFWVPDCPPRSAGHPVSETRLRSPKRLMGPCPGGRRAPRNDVCEADLSSNPVTLIRVCGCV